MGTITVGEGKGRVCFFFFSRIFAEHNGIYFFRNRRRFFRNYSEAVTVKLPPKEVILGHGLEDKTHIII